MIQSDKLKYSLNFNSNLATVEQGYWISPWFSAGASGLVYTWQEGVKTSNVPSGSSITVDYQISDSKDENSAWLTSILGQQGRYVRARAFLVKGENAVAPELQKLDLIPDIYSKESVVNIFQNSSFESGWSYWIYYDAITTTAQTSDSSACQITTEDSFLGTQSMKIDNEHDGFIYQAHALGLNTSKKYSLSFHVKKVDGSEVTNADVGAVPNNSLFPFDSITHITDGWYRCVKNNLSFLNNNWGIYVYGGHAVYVDCAQYEERTYATEFAETTRTIAKSIRVEESSTNLLRGSEDFDSIYWTKSRCTVSSNVVVAPNGTLTAGKVVSDTQTGGHYVYAPNASVSGTIYTLSFYAKKAEWDYAFCFIGNMSAFFDLKSGTTGSKHVSITNHTIKHVGNGWYRCTAVIPANSINPAIGFSSVDNESAVVGDGTSGGYLWGAQLEQKPYPTSYIPTTSGAVTRNNESLYMPSNSVRPEEGTIVVKMLVDGKINNLPSSNMYVFNMGLVGQSRVMFYRNAFSDWRAATSDGTSTTTASTGLGNLSPGWHTWAVRWNSEKLCVWLDGSEIVSARQLNPVIPIASYPLFLGTYSDTGLSALSNYDSFEVYQEALSDAEMISLTTL